MRTDTTSYLYNTVSMAVVQTYFFFPLSTLYQCDQWVVVSFLIFGKALILMRVNAANVNYIIYIVGTPTRFNVHELRVPGREFRDDRLDEIRPPRNYRVVAGH